MRTQRKALTSALMLASIASASAQNLVQNPSFDADLSGWTSSASVSWTPSFDHGGSGVKNGGAIALGAGSGAVFAEQCIHVDTNLKYVLRGWVNSQCGTTGELFIYWGDGSCNLSVEQLSVSSSMAKAWQELEITAVPATDLGRDVTATVVLYNSNTCADNVYFDDIYLAIDSIFQDNFDGK